MSVELPEAQILAEQMTSSLLDKKIKSYNVQDSVKLQKIGFMNKKLKDYARLVDCKIKSIEHRGNVIRIQMNKKMNLVLCPDYGAQILYHKDAETLPKKHHLKLEFTDGTFLTIRQTGMGLVYAATDQEVKELYVIKRDFSDIPSPVGEHDFTFEKFSELLDAKGQNIKAAIVGKTALVVGLSNAAFQEIIYKAGIHPKRNTKTLTDDEKHDVYDAMKQILNERINYGGKDNWVNLYGEHGRHIPVMGPNMKDKECPACGAAIEKIAHGGGSVYFCPRCQR
ncbi:MAG: DNA-formamidopyrimidine glycosylase family protein [Candidatus Thorarchaeota archaeon]